MNLDFFSHLRALDYFDLFLVWVVLYQALILMRHTGAVQVISGIGILAFGYVMSLWLNLYSFNWLLEKFFENIFLILVILFQGEIRRALAHLASNPFFRETASLEESHVVEELSKGLMMLAQKGYGGLVVIERDIELDYFLEIGTRIDSIISSEIMISLFHPQSPMHDGAVVVRQGRFEFGGCFLPLSRNPVLDKNLGTRHRAAIGLTEQTDAIVFVVSEELHRVGLVKGGQMDPDIDQAKIRETLFKFYGLKSTQERVL